MRAYKPVFIRSYLVCLHVGVDVGVGGGGLVAFGQIVKLNIKTKFLITETENTNVFARKMLVS